MSPYDDKVEQLRVVVLGAEGQGGLLREVSQLDKRVSVVEARTNVLTGKWLALMTLLAVAGNFLAALFARALFH